MKFVQDILMEMPNISKPQSKFIELLMRLIPAIFGRINFTSLARFSGINEKYFRRNFRKFFDFICFNATVIGKVLTKEKRLVAAFDPFFIEKAGKNTYGLAKFWNGSQSRAEKGLEASGLSIVEVDDATAFPLIAAQTLSDAEIKESFGEQATRVNYYASLIQNWQSQIAKLTDYIVADCYFTKKTFVDTVCALGFHFVGKMRKDAVLQLPYTGPQKRRGRPRKFAGKFKIDDLNCVKQEEPIDAKTDIYSGIFYSNSLERPVKVVVVRYKEHNKVGTAILFSTDISLEARDIYLFYKVRYQIEFVFRDVLEQSGKFLLYGKAKSSYF